MPSWGHLWPSWGLEASINYARFPFPCLHWFLAPLHGFVNWVVCFGSHQLLQACGAVRFIGVSVCCVSTMAKRHVSSTRFPAAASSTKAKGNSPGGGVSAASMASCSSSQPSKRRRRGSVHECAQVPIAPYVASQGDITAAPPKTKGLCAWGQCAFTKENHAVAIRDPVLQADVYVCQKHAAAFPRVCGFMGIDEACKKMANDTEWRHRETESERHAKGAPETRPFKPQEVIHDACMEVGAVRFATILNAEEWKEVHQKAPTARQPKPSEPYAHVLKDDGSFTWEKVARIGRSRWHTQRALQAASVTSHVCLAAKHQSLA